MKIVLINLFKRITYKLFGWYRYDIVSSRDLVAIISISSLYEDLEAGKVDEEIKRTSEILKNMREEDSKLSYEIQEFQREVDLKTNSLMIELINLRNELRPEDKEDMEELKNHYERVKSGLPPKTKKVNKVKELKKLRKLYLSLVKVYHPDKAPKGREKEYTEIFRTITTFRELGDYLGLKAFARTLKKKAKKQNRMSLKALKALLKGLKEDILNLETSRRAFRETQLFLDLERYRRNPRAYIREEIERIELSIMNLKNEKRMRDSYGLRTTSNRFTRRWDGL